MVLLVLAYPAFSDQDRLWIEAVRALHDPLALVVRAHLTLVFPISDIPEDALVAHTQSIAALAVPFDVEMRCATVVKDALSEQTHVFLVPDAGHAGLVKLHDRLYTGLLAARLRLDVPYIPHVTVKAAPDPAACKVLADTLNAQDIHVSARVSVLDVVRYENGRVETVARVPLNHPPLEPLSPDAPARLR